MDIIDDRRPKSQPAPTGRYVAAMEQMADVGQDLSQARDLKSVMAVVREAARNLTKADGASLVLRDGDNCHYVEENAISPLWKGQHFPMKTCISGWVMLNRKSVVIEDVYQDSRIPAGVYRPTFVQSLAMVPIRTEKPIGAIGNYWAMPHLVSEEELIILQALAHSTAVAMENIKLHAGRKNSHAGKIT